MLELGPLAPPSQRRAGLFSYQKKRMRAQTPGGFLGQGLRRPGEGRSEAETEMKREMETETRTEGDRATDGDVERDKQDK